MGWTTYYVGRYEKDKKALMIRDLEQYGDVKVLKASMKGNVFYAACIQTKRPEVIWGIVCLTSLKNGEFGYKDIDETMGPCYYDCPKSILDMLSPTDNEYALEWRKKCRENDGQTIAKKLNALPIGSIIEVNGKQYEKCKPSYQFKRPFWFNRREWNYISIKHIIAYSIVKVGA